MQPQSHPEFSLFILAESSLPIDFYSVQNLASKELEERIIFYITHPEHQKVLPSSLRAVMVLLRASDFHAVSSGNVDGKNWAKQSHRSALRYSSTSKAVFAAVFQRVLHPFQEVILKTFFDLTSDSRQMYRQHKSETSLSLLCSATRMVLNEEKNIQNTAPVVLINNEFLYFEVLLFCQDSCS